MSTLHQYINIWYDVIVCNVDRYSFELSKKAASMCILAAQNCIGVEEKTIETVVLEAVRLANNRQKQQNTVYFWFYSKVSG